uniref:Uncharacterized protein n=1 Tax=Oryza glumipatula TaxID=40148 RepID=A0A0D9ZR76_9ORYZ
MGINHNVEAYDGRGMINSTSWARKPEVQILTITTDLCQVYKLPHPNQAPRCVTHHAGTAQVRVSICCARAVVPALFHALIKASVPDVQELVRRFHARQGQETISITTFHLLLSHTSS